jgi:glutathionylspermidine synthase
LLPYLHQRYGLLDDIFIPAWHDRNACLSERVVAKSYYGRIGTEVEVLEPYQQTTLKGPVVYQKFVESAVFDGFLPVLCSWVINGRSAGVGIREQTTLITSDSCRFACHLVNYG